jgi:hypothetical protein
VNANKIVTKAVLEDVYFGEYLPILKKYTNQRYVKQVTEAKEISRFCLPFYIFLNIYYVSFCILCPAK